MISRPLRIRFVRLGCGVALAALASACSSDAALTTFTLSSPTQTARTGARIPGLLLIAQPTAIQIFSSDRILVKDAGGSVSYLPGAQWADQLPALLQSRMVQTFENSSRIGGVSRPGDRVSPDFQLNTEIRAFQLEPATGEAVVQLAVKAVSDANGRIAAARIFSSRVPLTAVDAANGVQALDRALSNVLLEVVRWAGTSSGTPPARTAEATPAQPG